MQVIEDLNVFSSMQDDHIDDFIVAESMLDPGLGSHSGGLDQFELHGLHVDTQNVQAVIECIVLVLASKEVHALDFALALVILAVEFEREAVRECGAAGVVGDALVIVLGDNGLGPLEGVGVQDLEVI